MEKRGKIRQFVVFHRRKAAPALGEIISLLLTMCSGATLSSYHGFAVSQLTVGWGGVEGGINSSAKFRVEEGKEQVKRCKGVFESEREREERKGRGGR